MNRFTDRPLALCTSILLCAGTLTAAVMTATPARAGTPVQNVGVPAYWSPRTAPGAAMFDRLAQNAPTVGITIINGPTSSAPIPFDQATATAIQEMHAAGEKVLGYVDTGYLGQTGHTTTRVNPGSTAIADWQVQMEQDADTWYSYYGAYGIDGIFFDETLSGCGTNNAYLDDYQTVTNYVRNQHLGAYITINPGTSSDECYTQIADTIMIFENSYSVFQTWAPPAYTANYPASKFWNVVYNVPQADVDSVIAQSKQNHAGYVYVTDRTLDATHFPYDQLPNTDAYWDEELLQAFGGVDTTPPTAPSGVHVTDSGCSASSCTVDLAWTRASDDAAVVGYDVYQGSTLVATVDGTSATVTGGMNPTTSYTFTIVARDEAANTGPGASVSTTTPPADTQPPTAPSGLTVTSKSGSSVTLSWTAATDNVGVAGYDIYQDSTLVTSVSGTTTSATVTIQGSQNGGSSYVYTVTAHDAAANVSNPSNQALVTIPPPTSGAIVNYSACMDSANAAYKATFTETFDYHRVFINTDDDTATGYQLPYGNPGMDYLVENNGLFQYAGTGTDWTWAPVSGVSPLASSGNGTYSWTVPASALPNAHDVQTVVFQAAGTSPEAYSAPLTLSRTDGTECVIPSSDTTPPSAPTNLRTTSITANYTTLAWDASTDNVAVTGYDVYQDGVFVTSVDGSTLTATVSGQTPASTFVYAVYARDGAGNVSAASDQLTVTNPAPTTGSITNYSACMTSSAAKFVATYDATYTYLHVFLDVDNETATGYQLPFGNPGGMDYMIENNALFQYAGSGTDWTWSQVAGVTPLTGTSGTTYTWQFAISALGSSRADPETIVFHGQTPDVYSQPITVTQTATCS